MKRVENYSQVSSSNIGFEISNDVDHRQQREFLSDAEHRASKRLDEDRIGTKKKRANVSLPLSLSRTSTRILAQQAVREFMELIGNVVQARACKPFGRTPLSSVMSRKLRDAKQATMSLHRVDASLPRLPAGALQLCFCERRGTG